MEKDFVIVPSGSMTTKGLESKSFSVFFSNSTLFQRQYWNHGGSSCGNYFIGWRKNCHLTEELADIDSGDGSKFI